MSTPKITWWCPSFARPELLGRMIACFSHQTYENRELIIIDESGVFDSQEGDRWKLISMKGVRFRSLGEKNNACIALASFDSDLLFKGDGDDCVMPWALEASVEALQRGEICQPRIACDFWDGQWLQMETYSKPDESGMRSFSFHCGWSMRREFFEKMRGYAPGTFAGDDVELDRKRRQMKIPSVGIDKKYPPFVFYNRPLAGRISTFRDSRQSYIDYPKGLDMTYVGKVPEYSGDPVWLWPIPDKRIARKW